LELNFQYNITNQILLWFSSFHKSKEQISSEQQLVDAAQKNPDNFAPIYELYFEQIFIFISKRIVEENTTAELTSEVFYKALYNIKKYKFKGLPFSAWLYRIASNTVAEYYRKQKKAQRHISLNGEQLVTIVSEVVDEDNYEDKKKLLLHLLEQLKEHEIQLLEFRFFENYSFKEIGEILGLTENNAKVKTFRVIKKMRKIADRNG